MDLARMMAMTSLFFFSGKRVYNFNNNKLASLS